MTGSTIKKSTTGNNTGRTDAPIPPHAGTQAQAGRFEPKELPGHAAFPEPHARTEPSWVEPSVPGDAAAQYRNEDPAFAPQSASPKRKSLRLALMAGIFIIGAGAGMIGAWWIAEPSVMRIDPGARTADPVQVVTIRKPSENPSGNKVRGISPSELPYDGAAPPEDPDTRPATPAPLAAKPQLPRVARPLADTAPIPAAQAQASGTSVSAPSVADSGPAAETSPPPAAEQRIGLIEQASAVDATSADQAGVDKPAPQADAIPPKPALKAAGAAKEGEGKRAAATQKRIAPARSAKDREIERIRQQAEEELKKKPESGRIIGRSRTNQSRSAKAQHRKDGAASVQTAGASERNVRASLAQCERAPNIFRREQCKWRICGGAWGKNGCPYYAPHVSNAY